MMITTHRSDFIICVEDLNSGIRLVNLTTHIDITVTVNRESGGYPSRCRWQSSVARMLKVPKILADYLHALTVLEAV